MRVALIQSPSKYMGRFVPLSLLCLASYIKQYNYNPIIIDLNMHFKSRKFHAEIFKHTAKNILRYNSQVLGFSVMSNTLPISLLIAKECKKMVPQLPIIFGGPDVSFEDVEILKIFKQIDIVVRGEGEITLTELLNALKKRKTLSEILGITYRENNQIIRNPDRPFIKNLDELPFLDFSLLPHLKKYETAQIEAGRGCPFRCTFCLTCKMWKGTFRIKSALKLAHELKQSYSFFKKDISIVHDNFLTSRKIIEKFLSLITDEHLMWNCSTRLELLDEELIKKLKKAGCRGIFIGIESASPKIQKGIKKNLPLSKLPRVLELLSQNGIQANLSFIIGFPNENKSQINQTLNMALRSKLYVCSSTVIVHPFTFFKGSELYTKAKENKKQIKFLNKVSNSLLTGLPAELALIKKYPLIFPSFYYVQSKDAQPKFLEKCCILFTTFLIDFFPLTTLSLLEHLKITPLQLSKKIIDFFEANRIKLLKFHNKNSSLLHYYPSFNDFIQKNSNPSIQEAFLHEKLLLWNKSKKI